VVRSLATSPLRTWISSVDLPGRGTTAVWQCAGPPDAETLVLLHGVTMTAELCWVRVLERLGRQFRIVAPDLRGHGDGIPLRGSRFRLEDSADDIAALADVLDIKRFAAVGYSMGGMVAQLLWRRHPRLVPGLVLCATARNVRGSWLEKLTSLYLPTMTTALHLMPFAQAITAEYLGGSLLGHIQDDGSWAWARAQLSKTSLLAAMSAVQSAVEFTCAQSADSAWVPDEKLNGWHTPAVVIGATLAGLRADELRRADVGDIRTGTDGGAVLHVRGKGSKDRAVPIEAELLAVIEDYLDSRASRLPATLTSSAGKGLSRWAANTPLFVGRDGGRITRGTIQSRVRRAFRRAGPTPSVRGALVHGLRHTYVICTGKRPVSYVSSAA
jgi:pimeloyl-ACP methyl ester carboxylesterase